MNVGPYYLKLDRNPFPNFWFLIVVLELAKAFIILSNPFAPHFIDWYFGFWKFAPYSFKPFFWLEHNGPVPYSMLWYAFNSITRFGPVPVYSFLFLLDLMIIVTLSRVHSQIFTLYLIWMSTYFLIGDTPDFLIWIFLVFARRKPVFLPLAFATKFPLIPPIQLLPSVDSGAVWDFILHSPISVHDPMNWVRYSIMIGAGLISLAGYFFDRREAAATRSR